MENKANENNPQSNNENIVSDVPNEKKEMSEAARKRYEQAFRNALSNLCFDDEGL